MSHKYEIYVCTAADLVVMQTAAVRSMFGQAETCHPVYKFLKEIACNEAGLKCKQCPISAKRSEGLTRVEGDV
jgi:hypothetical protein